jgi:glutaminase
MAIESDRIRATLASAYAEAARETGGKNADYIPFLAGVPSDLFGLALVTVGGEIFEQGDARYEFAIESISKVLTLAAAMEEAGPEQIRLKVGDRPTGLPFNSVIALELHDDRPLSPLVNAGAMATVSLLKAANAEDRWARILSMQSRLAGRTIRISDEVNRSEQTTNFHNRALAWLLYSAGNMYCDPMEACDVYTRQCSTLVTAVDLAVIGATLANGGINPLTREAVIKPDNVPPILAEMMMEGLYDAAGDWAFQVGIPAKSGVGGGLVAVVPGRFAIAGFAPPLDEVGNSIKAQVGVAAVAKALGSNLFRAT